LVEQIKWNEAFKRNFNKNDEEQASSKSYTNKTVSSGGVLFTNMITGGLCNDTNSNILKAFGNYNGAFLQDGTGDHGDKVVCFGTGGKCLLISCDYSESGSSGSDGYITPKNGNYFDDLISETNAVISDTSGIGFTRNIIRPSLLGTFLTNLR